MKLEIKKFWEPIPEEAIKIEDTFLSLIPLEPLCISAKNLRELMGITKQTLSYHIKKHKKSITIYVVKKKHYYQRKGDELKYQHKPKKKIKRQHKPKKTVNQKT